MKKFMNFMNGKFGKRVIKKQYAPVWRCITWGTAIYLGFLIFIPVIRWWRSVIDLLNLIIWG